MTRVFGFWVLFMVVGTTFMVLAFTITTTTSSRSSFPDSVFPGNSEMVKIHNRKLKEKSYNTSNEKSNKATDNMNLDDYHPIDPVPSSKASIETGPIEHGTPLMPFIPKLAPPNHPEHGGTASPLPT